MALGRYLFPALVGCVLLGGELRAQTTTGTITGRVVDSASQQGIPNVNVVVMGAQRGTLTREDGGFTLSAVPAGTQTIRASRIGYRPARQDVTITAGATANLTFTMTRQAAVLSEIVVTGYGTQRREAISGSVATVNADEAKVGVVTNVDQMMQARVAGVQMVQNSGEPGAGVQVRIRGGTSISASNDPLYVVDGVPLQNEAIAPGAAGVLFNAQLDRNPLNSINPNDIESITILKDAAATAIYGSRGANGVILITTKRATRGNGQMEYETYVGTSSVAKKLGLANGAEYRAYVQSQVAAGKLPASAASSLGSANTDWESEIMQHGIATNHNVAFSGGSTQTQYRASLNYFDQRGVVIQNGLKRYQGRLNATHDAFTGKLRLGLNLMASRVNNQYAPIENGGGFLGGLFTNMVIFNPTFPVKGTDGKYYETGTGAQDVRNPVGMARELQDNSPEDRLLGNLTGTVSLRQDLTTQTTLGVDNASAVRQTYMPITSPLGATYSGLARQADRSLQNLNFQQLLTYSPRFGTGQELEVVGGYEYTKTENKGFEAQMRGFITDAFGVNNLGAGTQAKSPAPTSYDVESQLVSFFSRANYGFNNKYFLTGVVRYDGSSRLAPGHQWAVFPAVSGSWRLSEESFFKGGMFNNLSLRAGWGKQGNQAVQPYQTQLLLRADPGASYPFNGVPSTGLRAAQVGNPDLKWETATQTNFGIDYGMWNDRVTGNIEVYQKDTKDLLLEVSVPQPAVVSTRIENIGSIRNRGFEMAADLQMYQRGSRTVTGGLVLTVERNKVTSLGGDRLFINSGFVSGQGQSNQYSERIMVGQPIGTFFGPRFLDVNAQGQQEFACKATSPGCTGGKTTNPAEEDKEILGNANPSFTLGYRNNATWGKFDLSWLWRGEFGGKVFNNTALVYQTKSDAKQGRNFLRAALNDKDDISEPAKFSSRWVEDRTFVRLQNVSVGYTFDLPSRLAVQSTRVYVSGDNLLLITGYNGYDPEVFSSNGGIATRGVDYLTYPRARTFTLGARVQF